MNIFLENFFRSWTELEFFPLFFSFLRFRTFSSQNFFFSVHFFRSKTFLSFKIIFSKHQKTLTFLKYPRKFFVEFFFEFSSYYLPRSGGRSGFVFLFLLFLFIAFSGTIGRVDPAKEEITEKKKRKIKSLVSYQRCSFFISSFFRILFFVKVFFALSSVCFPGNKSSKS